MTFVEPSYSHALLPNFHSTSLATFVRHKMRNAQSTKLRPRHCFKLAFTQYPAQSSKVFDLPKLPLLFACSPSWFLTHSQKILLPQYQFEVLLLGLAQNHTVLSISSGTSFQRPSDSCCVAAPTLLCPSVFHLLEPLFTHPEILHFDSVATAALDATSSPPSHNDVATPSSTHGQPTSANLDAGPSSTRAPFIPHMENNLTSPVSRHMFLAVLERKVRLVNDSLCSPKKCNLLYPIVYFFSSKHFYFSQHFFDSFATPARVSLLVLCSLKTLPTSTYSFFSSFVNTSNFT